MKTKITYEEASQLLEIREGILYWIAPTKGRRKKGSKAGNVNKVSGAVLVEIKGKNYHASHLSWLLSKKEYPKYKLEHISGNKLDNGVDNLREIIPESTEVTAELVRRIFDYVDGRLVCKAHLSARSQQKLGSVVGFIERSTEPNYRYIKIGGKRYKAANLVWLYHKGEMPKIILDHINHVSTDDRIENLREVTQRENAQNRALSNANTSGVTGVGRHLGKWQARISDSDGRRISLGCYEEFNEAVAARKAAEKIMGYHENHGRKECLK